MKPKQIDWKAGERQTLLAERIWLRSLTEQEAISLYCSLASFALAQQDDSEGWRRLEAERWQEKLALRRKLFQARSSSDRTNAQ